MPRKTRGTRPAALIAATLSGREAGDVLEQVITRPRQGGFGSGELEAVCAHLWPVRDKLSSGKTIDRDDVHRLRLLVQHLPQIRQIAAELLDFNSPLTRDSGAELLNYGLFIKKLPEVILDAGKQLGADMTPVCRFVRALDIEPTDEETARMMVDVRVCWDQCEARLRDAADSAEKREPCDLTAYRPACELWRVRFKTYKAFTVWLVKHGTNIRRDPAAPKNRLRLHAGDFLAAWTEHEKMAVDAEGPVLDSFKEGAAKRLANLRTEKDRSSQQGK